MLDKSKIYYLCGPYSGETGRNLKMINTVAAKLMLEGFTVFSPISHGAMIITGMDQKNSNHFISNDNWDNINLPILEKVCDEVLVIETFDGRTANSKGIKIELEFSKRFNKKITFINTDGKILNLKNV